MAEKERLTQSEMIAARRWAGLIASLVLDCPHDLARIIEACHRYDSIAPMLDPTGWLRHGKNVGDHKELFEAVARFKGALDRLFPPELRERA